LLKNLQASLNLILGDSQGRNKADTAITSSDNEHATLAGSSDNITRLGRESRSELDTEDQATAANLRDDIGELLLNSLEARDKLSRLLLDGALEFGRSQALDNVMGDTAGQRVSTEGGAVVASLDVRGDSFTRYNGRADGDAVTQGLGASQDIGVGSLARGLGQGWVGVCPQSTGTGQTALDLVKDQNGTNLVAALAQSSQELGGSDIDTSLTLDGLNNHTTSLIRDESLELLNIVVVAVLKSGDHR